MPVAFDGPIIARTRLPSFSKGDPVLPPVIHTQNLAKRYGDFEAVADLNVQVWRGELFGLLGPNGAGKTTTIRMLMGILQPSAGTARIDGMDCFTDRVEVKRRVGYLPDEPIFYDYLRGREILHFVGEMHSLPTRKIDERTRPLLDRLELTDAVEEFAVNYSRGMKKKLALICALLHDPMLLILDEPTSGLDPAGIRTLHELLREMTTAGKTVFYSTHLLDQAEKLCDRVGIVCRGKLALCGALDELRGHAPPNGSLEAIYFNVTGQAASETADPAGRAMS
jgi:ABC-2 type transport system ATP-binding protein